MNNFASLATVLVLSMAANGVSAQPQTHQNHSGHHAVATVTPVQREFRALDKNKDGKVSKAEMPAKHRMAAHFAMMDSNKDGALSEAEYTGH